MSRTNKSCQFAVRAIVWRGDFPNKLNTLIRLPVVER